ncbi:LysR family transcriptional regulator [Actinoplanes sp. NEAU-A12]|uniref:LysR family transcriptional regulator n=1 Tax=Actinoplanes sandaracinus TaxID=3045177 RepID=A0ABT6WST3_9ACTN|nr:LysR family transcriptional regulator [Actinoplanes sandaracinus]MDI6102797.1 LysR family transcriptional regulator [Actinoplanes sandaracinus]
MIDTGRLRILHQVSLEGSFSRAAATLRLTPSAVSQQIAALERSIGTVVVTRTARGVTLTQAGRLLVEAAEVVAAELTATRQRIDRLTHGRTPLRIATFGSGGRALLPAALTRLVAVHPELELTVLEREPEHSLPLVRDGSVDVALTYTLGEPQPLTSADQRRLIWAPLEEDPMYAVLPRTHPLSGRNRLDLSELVDERWVLGCLKTEDHLRRYAARVGMELDVAAATTDYFFAQALVRAGVGVSLIPRVALDESADLAVVELGPHRLVRHVAAVTTRRAAAAPHLVLLLRLLTERGPGRAR